MRVITKKTIDGRGQNWKSKSETWPESLSHMARTVGGQQSLNKKWSRLPALRDWHMAHNHPDRGLLLRH